MSDHSNRGNGGKAARAGGSRGLFDAPAANARPMSLEGKEALDLYLAKLGHNAEELKAQAALLQAALQDRIELLRSLESCQADKPK
jgi:hypothetical protein